MKKMNNRGFMLVESLVVCTFVVSVLIYFYVQFKNINKSFGNNYVYDNVNGLYGVNNISIYLSNLYINDTSFKNIIDNNEINDAPYYKRLYNEGNTTDIECNDYCTKLMNSLNVKKAVIANDNLDNLINNNINDDFYSEKMRDYIKYAKNKKTYEADYRILVEYNDETFASLSIRFES